jgi:hypothetical protein
MVVRTGLFVVVGGVLGGAVLIAAGYAVNALLMWADIRLYESEADMERNVVIVVALFVISVVGGAWFGFRRAQARDA